MLLAVSPIDGRYASRTSILQEYFSEYALIKYRVFVEIEYFIALVEQKIEGLEHFPVQKIAAIKDIANKFSQKDAEKIKATERITNHDVKAVEYFIKEAFGQLGLSDFKEFIHFGLTSQDINNTAIPISIKEALEQVYYPQLDNILTILQGVAKEWASIPMLARTHGQPASPTLLGREFMVFVERIETQYNLLKKLPHKGKFGGATGNFNAHFITYPDIDWHNFAAAFLKNRLDLDRMKYTTQIDHYDNMAAIFDTISRINTILIDLCRDIWTYVSMEYFKQKVKKGEIGSSAMPHKVNPIDFENAEGNLGIANAILQHLSSKLPISRLQRDLTDSTVLRNVGVPFGHILIAFSSIEKGMDKLLLNKSQLESDLEANWMVVAEAIQNVLRKVGYEQPYEKLKELTRGKAQITKTDIHNFIDTLEVEAAVKERLKLISPQNYTGPIF